MIGDRPSHPICRAWGEAEFYPGDTCESDTAARDCESWTSRLFSAFQFFDHSTSPVSKLLDQVGRSEDYAINVFQRNPGF
jgi:hypothetical protein